jgi:biopolymer transport protein ExbD
MGVSLKDPADGDLPEMSEINVTPFIDVVLVLLIIFMVAAPLSTVDVPVELPVSNAQPQTRPDKTVFLTIKSDLTLSIGNADVARERLQAALDLETAGNRDQRIFLRADGVVAYRDLTTVMNQLRNAGYLKIALVGLEDTGQAQTGQPPTGQAQSGPTPSAQQRPAASRP